MPAPYGSKRHTPPHNYHLLDAQQEPYKKKDNSQRKMFQFFGKG